MKKIILVFTVVLFSFNMFAQAPELMSYQAVIRNSSNALVVSSPVGMKISILQGSASGTIMYVETQTPSTNVNGLISIEIGSGTIVTGKLSAINWAKSTYFIQTEVDPTGGTNYTITGTSQLLSVPYALNALKADSLVGGIVEKEPAYNASVAKSITASDTTKWGQEIHHIGDSYGGGIVFYVYDGGLHGLIAATKDQDTAMRWYAGTYTNSLALANGIGAGKSNTELIIASQGYGDGATYAARVCHEYKDTVGGVVYADWYLPSLKELQLLYYQKNVVGGFENEYNLPYWSSTEYNNTLCWQWGLSQNLGGEGNKNLLLFVRAIRSF